MFGKRRYWYLLSTALYAVYLIHFSCNGVPIPFATSLINKALGNRWTFVSQVGKGFGKCAYWCLTVSHCKSINYWTSTGQCDLNGSDSTDPDVDLSTTAGCVVVDRSALPSSMAGGCKELACRRNQYCIPSPSSTPYCASALCPVGYTLYPDASFCYLLRTVCKYWADAREACQEDHADLLVLPDDATVRYFQQLIKVSVIEQCGKPYGSMMIGASKFNGDWLWTNGVILSPTDDNWGPEEPSGDGDCVELYYNVSREDYMFNDIPCTGYPSMIACQIFL